MEVKIYSKTVGATIFFSKRPLELEYIRSKVSLNSIIKKTQHFLP